MGDQNRGRRSASQPKVKLLELWERTSATTGRSYLSGFLGKLNVVGFAETRLHPKRPGKEVVVWSIFASEAEVSRREGG